MAEKSNPGPKSKKRSKPQYYSSNKKQKLSSDGALTPGLQGVLITTNDQEKICVPEAYNILNQYADQLYGAESASPDIPSDDIAGAMKAELSALKRRRFKSLKTGVNHVIFVCCESPVDPCELVHAILSDVKSKGQRITRFCQRILPIMKVCHVNEIDKQCVEVLEPHFHTDKLYKYAVSFKARYNNSIKREEVIKLIASMVTQEGTYDHVVDLTSPDLTIIVEIIKNLCCLSVVRDFNDLAKYNIDMLVKEDEPKTSEERPAVKTPVIDTSEECLKEEGTKELPPAEKTALVEEECCVEKRDEHTHVEKEQNDTSQ